MNIVDEAQAITFLYVAPQHGTRKARLDQGSDLATKFARPKLRAEIATKHVQQLRLQFRVVLALVLLSGLR
ncbi:hypothetical protein ADS78_08585 [Idiomarina abyssalis]|nr:hypothetical protein ADS78_08585 [Idiomarina abyssalis]